MKNKKLLARENSNRIRLSFGIDDIEYARILLLKKGNTYAEIASKEGKV